MEGETTGHDWWHIHRVLKNAKLISKNEKAEMFVVKIASLLHDIADWKFNDDEKVGSKFSRNLLKKYGIEEKDIKHICEIIENLSYKGNFKNGGITTIEGMVVQDADRLDAIGAIGIARVFATGSKYNEVIYDPRQETPKYLSVEEYTKSRKTEGRSSINHFYEKLLLIENLMSTKTGKKIAKERTKYMMDFLKQFFSEWNGEK
jgi:uncharacterized protein